jgi:hypothetical protein
MNAYSLIEIWRPRPDWYALSRQQKQDFVAKGTEILGGIAAKGGQLIGIHRCRSLSEGGWDVFAYWQMPTADLIVELSEQVELIGWNRYFEQINFVGKTLSPEVYLQGLITEP